MNAVVIWNGSRSDAYIMNDEFLRFLSLGGFVAVGKIVAPS